ncbi:MAG: F0F1 ATP synthase subunit epsilon [Alphaproteobacteria bacterium]|nr:F0F1 ATP synthase subunit epsilon [Alphaproteobacteria bacterium]
MADKVKFDLVSPERQLLSEDVDMVVVPGTEGDFGVLPGHAPVISTIRPGVIEVHKGTGAPDRIFLSGGICEVSANRCTVLADDAVEVATLDRASLEKRLKDAEEDLADAKTDLEQHKASTAVAVLREMMQAAGR